MITNKRKMRIALVYLGRRGSGEPISYQLATGLAVHAQVLAVVSSNISNLSVWKKSGLDLLITPTYKNTIQALISWLNPLPIRRLAEQISSWKPDVLIFPMFYTWNPFLQRRLSEVPSVIWVHDPMPHPGMVGQIYAWMENISIRLAKRCVVLSPGYENIMYKRGASPGCIDVLPHGNLSFYLRFQDPSSSQHVEKQPVVLFFGRIDAYKGIDVLLKAWESLEGQSQLQPQACLRIVGSGSMAQYQPLLKRLRNVEVINRWADDSEIPQLFQGVKMVVLPYTTASQSGVIPLAAVFGVPVIASQVGGIPYQIKDGESGLLIEPGSSSALASALVDLLSHPEKTARLGAALKEDYSRERNWEKISGQLYQICQQALIG